MQRRYYAAHSCLYEIAFIFGRALFLSFLCLSFCPPIFVRFHPPLKINSAAFSSSSFSGVILFAALLFSIGGGIFLL